MKWDGVPGYVAVSLPGNHTSRQELVVSSLCLTSLPLGPAVFSSLLCRLFFRPRRHSCYPAVVTCRLVLAPSQSMIGGSGGMQTVVRYLMQNNWGPILDRLVVGSEFRLISTGLVSLGHAGLGGDQRNVTIGWQQSRSRQVGYGKCSIIQFMMVYGCYANHSLAIWVRVRCCRL